MPFSAQHLTWAGIQDACLYCSEPEPKGGEEHVLSVALGNWFWVIPPGVVCGQCNNGMLSALDTRLQTHPLIALVRTLAGIGGRRGQPPAVGASNLQMKRDEAPTPADRASDALQP